MRLRLVTAALFFAACHDEPLVVSKEQLAAGSYSAAGRTADGTTPVSKPTVVLFRQRQGQLVPLACYDKARQALRSGEDCVGLVPDGAEVRIGDGYGGRLQRGEPLSCRTAAGPTSRSTFGVSDGPPGDAGPQPGPPLALWSSGPMPKLELPPSPPDPLPLPPSETLYITNAARNLLPAAQRALLGPVVVDNVWSVDLDLDGLRERLDQVRLLDVKSRFVMLTGVFVVAGKDAVALRPLRVQALESPQRERLGRDDRTHEVRMLAALDLDHDRRREVWLQVVRPDSITDSIGRFTDTGVAVFAELTCPSEPPPRVPPKPPNPANERSPSRL